MPLLVRNGKTRKLNTLAWLLDHAKLATTVTVTRVDRTKAMLVAELDGGGHFEAHFESFPVAKAWARKPRRFANAKVTVTG